MFHEKSSFHLSRLRFQRSTYYCNLQGQAKLPRHVPGSSGRPRGAFRASILIATRCWCVWPKYYNSQILLLRNCAYNDSTSGDEQYHTISSSIFVCRRDSLSFTATDSWLILRIFKQVRPEFITDAIHYSCCGTWLRRPLSTCENRHHHRCNFLGNPSSWC